MSERAVRPLDTAAAAAVIGGILTAFMPQHAVSIAGLVIVTIAAAAALHALSVNAPAAWWFSPFEAPASRRSSRRASDDVALIRSRFAGPRQQLPGGPALPPATLRLLQPLIVVALERRGMDPTSEAAHALLSSMSRSILAAGADRPPWFSMRPPAPERTAAVVQAVLDELERLEATPGTPPATTSSSTTRDPG